MRLFCLTLLVLVAAACGERNSSSSSSPSVSEDKWEFKPAYGSVIKKDEIVEGRITQTEGRLHFSIRGDFDCNLGQEGAEGEVAVYKCVLNENSNQPGDHAMELIVENKSTGKIVKSKSVYTVR